MGEGAAGEPDRRFMERFAAARDAGRLPHALLLVGPDPHSLEVTALAAARSLLGPSPLAKLDLSVVRPTGKTQQISAEAARDAVERMQLSSRGGGARAVVIHGADRLHRSAANSILKTLEEPPPGAFFFLTARRIGDVLFTIRSRCQLHRCGHSHPSERHPDWQRWLLDYGTYVRRCLNDGLQPLSILDGYALVAAFRRILGDLATVAAGENSELIEEEAAAALAGARRVAAESLLADCGICLLSIMKELATDGGHGRRIAILRLSRQLAALDRAAWLLEKNCSEPAVVESFLLAPYH